MNYSMGVTYTLESEYETHFGCDARKHSLRELTVGLIKYVIRSHTQSDA